MWLPVSGEGRPESLGGVCEVCGPETDILEATASHPGRSGEESPLGRVAFPPFGREASQTTGFLDGRSRHGMHRPSPPLPTGRTIFPRLPVPPPSFAIDVRPGGGDGGTIHPVESTADKGVARLGVRHWGCWGTAVDRDVGWGSRRAPPITASSPRKRGPPFAGFAVGKQCRAGHCPAQLSSLLLVLPTEVPAFAGMTRWRLWESSDYGRCRGVLLP